MICGIDGHAHRIGVGPISCFEQEIAMKSPVVKRSILSNGHKTSVSLEEPFWSSVKEISRARGMTLSELVSEIDANRQQGNLSSAIRLFVLDHFKSRAADPH
jgi:predicted DNA-binding ribbon-helix-helix protein